MRHYLHLAPLQSFTDYHFRNAFQETLGDVDRFYAPYLKMNNDGSLKEGPKNDVLVENNPFETVVPQVMAASASDFLVMARYLEELGYTELNWNLGCPYPMVAKRDLGAGILNKPEKICAILSEVQQQTPLKIGLKMRMGYEDTSDILRILPALNHFELTEIIVHARYGKQLYQGTCDHERFAACIPLTNHRLIYNGDILTVADFRYLKNMFPTISHWMLGRGAVANPFLFEMIQEDTEDFPEDWLEVFLEFVNHLLESHLKASTNEGNILVKMQHYWEYFSTAHETLRELGKRVKKCKNLEEYVRKIEMW
jgi:tRNA-dihydrouridine synthase